MRPASARPVSRPRRWPGKVRGEIMTGRIRIPNQPARIFQNRGIAHTPAGMTGRQPASAALPRGFPLWRDYHRFMAQQIQTLFIDDLDGGEAAGTVRFGLDGTEYEIDLSTAHSDELRNALEQYVTHARRTGSTARRAARGSRGSSPVDNAKIRQWAKEQGIEIRERGRVPANVVEKYKTAAGA